MSLYLSQVLPYKTQRERSQRESSRGERPAWSGHRPGRTGLWIPRCCLPSFSSPFLGYLLPYRDPQSNEFISYVIQFWPLGHKQKCFVENSKSTWKLVPVCPCCFCASAGVSRSSSKSGTRQWGQCLCNRERARVPYHTGRRLALDCLHPLEKDRKFCDSVSTVNKDFLLITA